MKFDPFKWSEVKPDGTTYESPKGRLHLLCSKVAACYVTVQGVEALAGVGTEIDVQIADEMTFRVESEPDARAFVEMPRAIHIRPAGERFTNIDRRPEESGTLAAVRAELRRHQLAERELLRTIRAETVALERKRQNISRPPEEPEPAPAEPDPAPDPAPAAA